MYSALRTRSQCTPMIKNKSRVVGVGSFEKKNILADDNLHSKRFSHLTKTRIG